MKKILNFGMFIVIIFCLINMVAVIIKPNNNNQEQNI